MIKVLIVDDEYLVRERLKICVDWNELGYEIAGDAGNGEDALMMLEHIPAQLAIVDINMPIINGLEFAQLVQIKHPEMKIILLTGYSSFEYAKTALQAGVSDYLLKPINMDELTQVLKKLHDRFEAELQKKQMNEHLQQSQKESDTILQRKFIQSVLKGTATRKDLDKFQVYCPNLREGALFVISVSIDKTTAEGKSQPLWMRFAVSNIFNEIFVKGGVKFFEISYDEENRNILIIHIKDMGHADVELGFILKTCLDAIRAVSGHLKFTVTAGVGTVVKSIDEATVSYKEAIMACKHKTIYGSNRIIRYDTFLDKTLSHDLSYIREEIIIQLRLGNFAAIEEELHKRFEAIMEHKQSINKLYSVLYEFMVVLNIFSTENKLDSIQAASEPFNPSQLVDELESIQEIEHWVQEAYRNVLLRVKSLKQSTPAKLVEKAKQYIDIHYANVELDLTEIAGSIFIHPSYLSRIFKNEMEYSVVEYLTKCRMVKAKNLMEQGCKNLYFIAESVGYKDTHYFSKCFKRYYSVSPSKFIAAD